MDDFLSEHIELARSAHLGGPVANRIAGGRWPAGVAERAEPAALGWLRRWRPERLGMTIPSCSCQTGHCLLCN